MDSKKNYSEQIKDHLLKSEFVYPKMHRSIKGFKRIADYLEKKQDQKGLKKLKKHIINFFR